MRFLFPLLCSSVVSLSALSAWLPFQPVPANLDPFNSTAGIGLFVDAATERTAFMQLAQHFETQYTQSWCGIASAVAMFNALHVQAPVDPSYDPYPYFTQADYFNDCVENLIGKDPSGITLDQWATTVTCWGGKATVVHAANTTVQAFTDLARSAMNKGSQVIINFYRAGLEEVGGGHFSPLAAYSPAADKFLIMDVARYKYPPVWASSKDVYTAMNTIDTSSNITRGFAILSV